MAKHGKRFRAAEDRREKTRYYEIREALELVKGMASAKFDETVDAAIRLNVDPRHADQIVRGTVNLPHGTGKSIRVLAIADGDKAREAEEAGADYVGTEYIERIQGGWLEFDAVVATPDTMREVGKLGRILGPRGLMPTPKAGTVTMDLGKAVQRACAHRQDVVRARQAGGELPGLHGCCDARPAVGREGRLRPQREHLE
jgi:large subunit ribosomal protein L1